MTAPTLIIGLGGIGSDIVGMVERKTRHRGIDTTNIKFLLIDTDHIALCRHKENGFTGKTIRISKNVTVESCLNQNDNAKNNWYPHNGIFNHKTLTDGAGQVRSISRLAFEDAIVHKELQQLYDDIHELHLTHHNPEGKTLRIAVVSSLAGGTGSGIILPFAVHLGDYLSTTFPDNGYNMSGFFMMPDIVLMNNGSNAIERISLNSNAYATIKELDAFIQKNVGTKINVKAAITLPEQSRKKDVSIYNFNFLFGILNNDAASVTLKSMMQYEDMMADSVFMAFCSPINELNSTREDNKFKHLAIMLGMKEEKRYNTFGSIGVAVLQYPYDQIRAYLTMLWVQDILKSEWFYYDELYETELRDHIKQMEKGAENVDFKQKSEHYIDIINQKNDSFSSQIKTNLIDKETGKSVWKLYTEKVKNYIHKMVLKKERDTFVAEYTMQDMWLNNLKGFTWSRKLKSYQEKYSQQMRGLYKNHTEAVDSFRKKLREDLYGERSPHMEIKDHHLDYWLKNRPEGSMRKPNVIRYFLGKVCEQFLEDQKWYEAECNSLNIKLEALEKSIKNGEKLSKKDLIKRIKEIRELFENYAVLSVSLDCVQEGFRHTESLYSAYEDLFEDYRKGFDQLEDKIQVKKNEMICVTGTRRQVICCTDETLSAMHELMVNASSNYYGTLSTVSMQMYQEAKDIIIRKQKHQNRKRNIWESVLKGWEDEFEKTYGSEINMDILSALEWEIKHNNEEESKIDVEMESKINNSVNKLSAPFLKTNNNKNITTIEENYFHSSLQCLKGDKKLIVDQLLMGHNGVPGTIGIDKYTIFFYKSMFGVDADELYPFEEDGAYYSDYQQITRYMHMNNAATEILTPHIDRTWHRSDILPEMSRKKQQFEMCCQWEALIYGLINNNKIILNTKEYVVNSANVKNRMCSNLFQVMDIIRDYKEVREDIRDNISKDFYNEKQTNNNYENGTFYHNFEKIDLIKDIFVKYMENFNYRAQKDQASWETDCFLEAWENLLTQYLTVYTQDDPQIIANIIENTINNTKLTQQEKADNKVMLDFLIIAVKKRFGNISLNI